MKKIYLGVILSFLIFGKALGYQKSSVEELYKWKKVVYENLPRSENSYVGPHRYYDPKNCDIMSMAFHQLSGLMIVNVGRLRPGVPATIAAFCVQDYPTGSSPKIWGFPNYEVNALRASDFTDGRAFDDNESRTHKRKPYKPHHGNNYYYGSHHYVNQRPYYPKPAPITTTPKPKDDFRIVESFMSTVDERCNRAFMTDTGILNYYGNDTRVIQKPALLVFDLSSDCCETRNFPLLRRSVIPDDVVGDIPFGVLFYTLDYQSNDCEDVFAYISNTFTSYLIVYDYKNDDWWSFRDHPTFTPVIAESYFVFDKTFNYELPLGIISVSLGYRDKNGDRMAYYFPEASTAQFAVSTKVLKDKRKAPRNYHLDDFRIMGYRGCNAQTTNVVVDYTYGVAFYLEIQTNRVTCWNIKKPLNPDNIGVVFESDKYLFGVQSFVDSRGYLWFNSCSLPIMFQSDIPLNLQKVNSRIFRVKVSDAIRGTVCEDEDDYRLTDFDNDYGY